MSYVITRYERVRDENGMLTNKIEPTQDMASFATREEAESRLGSFVLFELGFTHAGFRIREVADVEGK